MNKDSLNNVKRRVYMAALAGGGLAVVLLWANSGLTDPSMMVTFPLFALFSLGCIWALWRRTVPVLVIERMAFVGGAGFALIHLAHALYVSEDLSGARTNVTEISFLTLTALYVVATHVFDRSAALRISLALFGTSLVFVLTKVVLEIPAGLNIEEISWVVRMNGFMAAIIAFSYASSYVKDEMLQQRIATETMRQLAHTDQLTGVANRRRFCTDLREEMEKAQRYGRPLCVILFDLDNFKHINDSYGHDRGDAVLREIVRAIDPLLRVSDRLGRWGGEEFIIVTPETDLLQSHWLAERLRGSIAHHEIDSTPGVTASFGIASFVPGDTEQTLIKRADEALYRAKTQGRNRVEAAA
ncbi:MAG: diguanylate cyclase [Rubrobacter sp.]|nr:diguanylate cyclase [Rubrobacter sp.]